MKKSDREIVYKKFDGHCAYCGDLLKKGWHIDHLIPVKRGWDYIIDKNGKRVLDSNYNPKKKWYMENPENDIFENWMPSCPSCNINKHSMTIEEFRRFIACFIVSLNRDSTQYKIAKRYGLIEETTKRVTFYFEKLF